MVPPNQAHTPVEATASIIGIESIERAQASPCSTVALEKKNPLRSAFVVLVVWFQGLKKKKKKKKRWG